jgi:hypothetical protein
VIDFVGGNDAQYRTYVPVENDAEIEALKATSQYELLKFFPRLQLDWPTDAPTPAVQWIR